MLTREIIINDLKNYYTDEEFIEHTGFDFDNIGDKELAYFFNHHCQKHKVAVSAQTLYDHFGDATFVINTPDGFKEVGELYKKGVKPIYTIETSDHSIKCSDDHLIQTPTKWEYAKNLHKGDLILTKDGFQEINYIREGKESEVYDLEVLYDEHRYWGGTGICSHNSGKSYLALSICRNAQKKGYIPVYMDSESAIDKDFVERLGCDSKNFIIKQVTTISEVSTFVANFCQRLLAMPEKDRYKVIFVLDSLGNLTSTKEFTDTIEGNSKRDMTKQQEIKALFRTNTTALGKLNIPFIVNSHIYQTTDLFSKQVVSGGCLGKGEEIITESGCKLIEDVKQGERVLTADGTYQEVLKTFTFEKPAITFTFEDGRTITCSSEHRFLVENDITKESSWKMAKDLNEDDVILEYDFNG